MSVHDTSRSSTTIWNAPNCKTTEMVVVDTATGLDSMNLSARSIEPNATLDSHAACAVETTAADVAAGGIVDFPYPSGYGWTRITVSSIVVTCIMLVIVLGNALVVVAVAVDRNLKGPQNWFIASLAVSDLLVGLFIMPLSLSNELLGFWPFGAVLCQLWLATDVLLCTASILNLCLISLDRYWSIVRAVAYLRQRTPRRAALMIVTVWTLSAVICFPPLAGWSRPQPVVDGKPQCVLSEEPGYVIYSIIGSFYLPLCVMVAVYVKIYMAARWRARRRLAAGSMMSTKSVASIGSVKMAVNTPSLKYADGDQRCSRRHLPGKRPVPHPVYDPRFLSPEHHAGGEPQRSSVSIDLDSEPTDDRIIQHEKPHMEQSESSKLIMDTTSACRCHDMMSVSAAVPDELLTIVMVDQRSKKEQKIDSDDVIMQSDVVCVTDIAQYGTVVDNNTVMKSLRAAVPEVEQTLTSASGERIGEIVGVTSTISQTRGDGIITTTTRRSASDRVVVVVISSMAESTTPKLTSALAKMSAADIIDIRRRRPSSTSSFLTTSTTCSPNKFVACATTSGVDENNSLVNCTNTVRDYQSTRMNYGGSAASPMVSVAAEDETVDSTVPRPRRKLRASWTSAGTRRRLSIATATASGRRGAKAEGLFADTERAKRKAARARERRATIVLGIVMASFIGCWLPFFAVYPVALLTGAKVPGPLFGVIFWLGYCNSALNPIIYTVFNRDFRRAFQKIVVERIVPRKSTSWV